MNILRQQMTTETIRTGLMSPPHFLFFLCLSFTSMYLHLPRKEQKFNSHLFFIPAAIFLALKLPFYRLEGQGEIDYLERVYIRNNTTTMEDLELFIPEIHSFIYSLAMLFLIVMLINCKTEGEGISFY